ncbi:MAG: hypothetical protein JXB18_12155, partial [Sedimentisphaerales bacterium]|nr:hypothetical protein [Sedimentisphaerales bacterium]
MAKKQEYKDSRIPGYKNWKLALFCAEILVFRSKMVKLGLFCRIMFFATEGTEGYEGIKLGLFGGKQEYKDAGIQGYKEKIRNPKLEILNKNWK